MNSIIKSFLLVLTVLLLSACSESETETVSTQTEVDPVEYKNELAILYDEYLTSNQAALQLMIDYTIDFNTTYDTQPLLEEAQVQLAIIKELQAMDVPAEYKTAHREFLKAVGANSMATSQFGEDYFNLGALEAGQNWNESIQQTDIEDVEAKYQEIIK